MQKFSAMGHRLLYTNSASSNRIFPRVCHNNYLECIDSSFFLGVMLGADPLAVSHETPLWLVQAIIIIGITRTLSLFGEYVKQPRVIFEIIGGILLGPSAIGRNEWFLLNVFPKATLGYIGIVADVGLILYLFLVGLELDPKLLAANGKHASAVALTGKLNCILQLQYNSRFSCFLNVKVVFFLSSIGMALPFGLGVAISNTLFKHCMQDDPAFKDVCLFS